MNERELLIKAITEGIQEKKGKSIVIANLTDIEDTICQYFIVCQGNSPTQVAAITQEVVEHTQDTTGQKPQHIDGLRNAEWVAIDYTDVVVHVFVPQAREFYDIEHLWEDAALTSIDDLD